MTKYLKVDTVSTYYIILMSFVFKNLISNIVMVEIYNDKK